MSKVLVDSSCWIEYFKSSERLNILEELIETNLICINNLILTELIPYLEIKGFTEVIDSLKSIENIPLVINWNIIIQMQTANLKNGINKVGIPDLIILQNIIDNDLILFSLDKHFLLMNELFEFKIYEYNKEST
jgi:predicted nucleic acid-binding protein